MSKSKALTKKDWNMLWLFLFYTFAIAWGTEFLLIAVYHFELLKGGPVLFLHFAVIGFGAGMAPAYAAFIIWRKDEHITLREFFKRIFRNHNSWRTVVFLIVFAMIQFVVCAVQEEYLGNPWYLFILFMPMMILGGGLEEVGWRGMFQPLLEKRFSFIVSALIEGCIWSVWHLPLWFVANTAQASYDFIAFTLYCITLGLTLAAIYRLTKCIWATVLIHAWGNTVLGGMYTLTTLTNVPSIKILTAYLIQVILILYILFVQKKRHGIFEL